MKRILFTAAGICSFICALAQAPLADSSEFRSRKLKVEEINFVSSYYRQDGDNAAVTGGIGSEKLTDIANIIDVKLIKYDRKLRKHSLDAELGIDHYTSASSDRVDLKANSSASHADTRFYPSLSWSRENETKGSVIGAGLSASKEYDYSSFGANISFTQKTKNKNGEFSAKFQAYLDNVKLIMPVELRPGYTVTGRENKNYGSAARNTFAGSLSYSQIVNEKLQLVVLADIVQQNGYLSLPFHRVYFADGSVHMEDLPSSRFKLPLGVRANYFLGDRIIVRTYYRFYTDDWGLRSNTAEIEVPVKITPFISVSPFYRYYDQSSSDQFAPYKAHTAQDTYHTSNYDYAEFQSNFIGAGFRTAPPKGILNHKNFTMVEIRYGHYLRSTGLNSDILSLNLRFK